MSADISQATPWPPEGSSGAGDAATPVPEPAAPPTSSDEDLLHGIAMGQTTALTDLHRRYARLLYGLGLRMLSVPTLAAQGVEDTFVTVWNNAAFYDPTRASGRGWLVSIAHHRFLHLLRETGASLPLGDWFDRVDAPTDTNQQLLALAYYRGEPLLKLSEISGLNLRGVENALRAAADSLNPVEETLPTTKEEPAPPQEIGTPPAFSGVEPSTFGFGVQGDIQEWERTTPSASPSTPKATAQEPS